ncbi:hypothetical protein D9M72_285480 [compost metagenome]
MRGAPRLLAGPRQGNGAGGLVALRGLPCLQGRPDTRSALGGVQARALILHGWLACQQRRVRGLRLLAFLQSRRHLLAGTQRRLRCGQRGARALFLPLQRLQLGLQCLDSLGQRLRRFHANLAQRFVALDGDALGIAADAGGLGLQQLFHAPVQLGAEQALQNGLARLRAGSQQFTEAPLRQHDHLAELRTVEAQQVAHRIADPGGLAGLADPVVAVMQVQLGLGRLGHPALAALLGPLLHRRAHHAPALRAQAELQRHLGAQRGRGVGAAHGLRTALAAGGIAVQRKADRVEQRGLARAGGAMDQHEGLLA